jgi:hypothetical protein
MRQIRAISQEEKFDGRTFVAGGGLAKAREVFNKYGGMLRTGNAIRLGIHPRTLFTLLGRLGRDLTGWLRTLHALCRSAPFQPGSRSRRDSNPARSSLPDLGARSPRSDEAGSAFRRSCAAQSCSDSEDRWCPAACVLVFQTIVQRRHCNRQDGRGAGADLFAREDHRRLFQVPEQDRARSQINRVQKVMRPYLEAVL